MLLLVITYSWDHVSYSFDTVVLSRIVLDVQTSTTCKGCQIVLLEALRIAALIPQAARNKSITMVFKSLGDLAL